MKKKKCLMLGVLLFLMAGCGTGQTQGKQGGTTELQVFVAASLNTVMTRLAEEFYEEHPEVTIVLHPDSSGTLMTQIQEGYACDMFFSADQKQMDILEQEGLLVDGTRTDVVNNQVVVIAGKDSGTKVTGLENLGEAESIALAGGSVPVGKYTRQAMVNLGMLLQEGDVADITTEKIAKALGGVEISEQSNVSKVLIAVVEGSCQVGTVYRSDLYGREGQIEILQRVSMELTGAVTYPISRVKNQEADMLQNQWAQAFYEFVCSDRAKEIFESFSFDTNVE